MAGSVFKRCAKCATRVKARQCGKCGSTSLNWAIQVDVGKDANGRRMQQHRSGFATKAEAERTLQELHTALNRGAYVLRSKVTVAEYLRDEWLEATAPPQVKYETWNDRGRNLENYVLPRIGGVALQELNAAHINRLYADLLQAGRVNGQGGLSPTSVRRIHAMLRKALHDAVRWGRVSSNPTDAADPPPQKAVNASRRASMRTWTSDELRQFLNVTTEHPLHPLWFFAAHTGLRRSELLGLRWSNLDLNAATATVRQTVTPHEGGYYPQDDQKSDRSARTVHLDNRTVAVLQAHARQQRSLREQIGRQWQDHGLVFCQPDGSWWNPPAVTLAFTRAVRSASVPPVRLHDLRHTHASLLLAAGVNPKVVSERLGHSSVAFTLDTYAHVMPGMQSEAAELFSDLVYGPPAEEDPPGPPPSGGSPSEADSQQIEEDDS